MSVAPAVGPHRHHACAAAPAVGGDAPRALAVGLGLLLVLAPYAWATGWGRSFTLAGLGVDVLALAPYLVLATLASGRTALLCRRSAVLAGAALAVTTVLMQRHASAAPDAGAVYALVWAPGLQLAGLGVLWALDAGWHRGGPLRSVRLDAAPSTELLVGVAGAVVLVVAVLRGVAASDQGDALRTFAVVLVSIAVEALPFVLLGGLVSAAIAVYVPDRIFERVGQMPVVAQVPCAIAAGFLFPVCECGSVPVARRLLLRGLHPSAALAFMLASPVVNPVVLGSTLVAFQGRDAVTVAVGRALLGMVVAATAGVLLGRGRVGAALKAHAVASTGGHGHDHDHDEADACDDGCGHDHHGHGASRPAAFVGHLTADVLFMGRFIVLGAGLAAAVQVVLPLSTFSGALASPVVGTFVLMGAAFVLSLCSEADAFVAVSFVGFPLAAQLAFLAFGPVLDLKLALLYGATFGRAFVLRLALLGVPLVASLALAYDLLT